MEIVMLITVIAFGIIIWNIYDHIIRLNKTVNKQQEQINKQHQHIDKILAFNKTQSVVNKDLVDISKDIANKVISIEERVDKYTKIVE